MSDMPPRKSPTRLQRLRRTIMAGLTIIAPLWGYWLGTQDAVQLGPTASPRR